MHNLFGRTTRLLCAAALAMAGLARAEEVAPPPSNSFELSLGLGYGQGLGPVASGVPTLQEFGSAGATLTLEPGWRIDPNFLVGAYGEVSAFDGGTMANADHATSVAAGLQGQFHAMPGRKYDPWIGVGFGWRGYWASQSTIGTHKLQGLDLARVRIGVDYRVSPTVALGPVFGMTLTDFLSEKRPGASSYTDTSDRKLNTFVFGGLAGRFDL
jgi:hypothetical protein